VNEEDLKRAGLTGNESKVYLELLRRGSISGSVLAKKVGLDRTLTYQLLNSLVEKGMTNYIVKENKKYFSPASPENLLNKVREQEEFIKKIIPELVSLEKIKETEQEIQIYEGKAGLRALYQEVYRLKEICFFGATGRSYDVLKYELPRIAKELAERGLKGRGIADESIKNQPFTKLKNLKIKYLRNAKSYDTATTITSDDRVAIHCLAGEKPLIIIIKNKYIADTYKNYFEILWSVAKE